MAKKNQVVIDLGKIELSDEQRKDLQNALHKTVSKNLKNLNASKKGVPTLKTMSNTRSLLTTAVETEADTKTANLTVTFTDTEPGLSNLNATCNGVEKTITRSGKITFENVTAGNRIKIKGDSLGHTTVTIDIGASPTQMNFPPGHFNGSFFIM
jgi:hypothetical protein